MNLERSSAVSSKRRRRVDESNEVSSIVGQQRTRQRPAGRLSTGVSPLLPLPPPPPPPPLTPPLPPNRPQLEWAPAGVEWPRPLRAGSRGHVRHICTKMIACKPEA